MGAFDRAHHVMQRQHGRGLVARHGVLALEFSTASGLPSTLTRLADAASAHFQRLKIRPSANIVLI